MTLDGNILNNLGILRCNDRMSLWERLLSRRRELMFEDVYSPTSTGPRIIYLTEAAVDSRYPGRSITSLAPPLAPLEAEIVPPWARMTASTNASPKPWPLEFLPLVCRLK